MFQRYRLPIFKDLIWINPSCKKFQSRCFYDVGTRNDTIFAPATIIPSNSKGSPLGVIRVSGPLTKTIIPKFTNLSPQSISKRENGLKTIEPRKAKLAEIFSPTCPTEVIDIGLVIWFPKPNSFTGEDVCEFHVHGSQAIMKHVLDQLGRFDNVRPAEPGEFSKRAVINNKMSLIQAESLPHLIAARTDKQRKLALRGLEGFVVKRYESWLAELVNILAHLEASIDFGEDELIGEVQVVNNCITKLGELSRQLEKYIAHQAQSSNYILNGFKVTIMGRPNVGKSSLMNKLCQKERSIVSDVCGTTRDVIEQSFELGGHSLTLCDTAGLRDFDNQKGLVNNDINNQHDLIEQEGIKRALVEASKADVILYVIDVEDLLNSEDNLICLSEEITSLLKGLECSRSEPNSNQKIVHLILNKIDLKETNIDKCQKIFNELEQSVKSQLVFSSNDHKYSIIKNMVSCKTDENLEKLIDKLSHQLDMMVSCSTNEDKAQDLEGLEFVNERHLAFLRSCQRNVHQAAKLDLATIDQMAQYVRDATDYLSRCLGTVTNEQVLDVIFRDFCIGK